MIVIKNIIKKIIKKILSKLFAQILREIDQSKDIQKEILNKYIELDMGIKELKNNDEIINKIENLNNHIIEIDQSKDIQKEILNKYIELDVSIKELKNSDEIIKRIENLDNHITEIEQENEKLKNYIENMSLITNRNSSIRKIRVVFLIHNVESWYTMQSIYEAMIEDNVFEPILISVPRTYNHDDMFIDKSVDYLARKYKNVISFKNYENIPKNIIFMLNPDIIFRQSPWEDDIPDVFRTENIKQFKICYIPYAISCLNLNETNFNQSLHNYAWRLYCESEFYKESYRKHNLVSDCNTLVCGNTKYEQMTKLLNGDNESLVWPIKRKNESSIRILWAPHHALEGWTGFSTFHIIYEEMYKFAFNNSDIEIVLRPHPALAEVMNNTGLIKKEKLEEYYQKFNTLENCYVDFGQEYINLFKYSDILVTDGVSFLFEYIVTGKPIIHTDSKKHSEFNEFGRQFERSWYKAYSFDELKEKIQMLINGQDPILEERLTLKERLFNFSEGNKPSEIIIDDIKSSLKLSVGD